MLGFLDIQDNYDDIGDVFNPVSSSNSTQNSPFLRFYNFIVKNISNQNSRLLNKAADSSAATSLPNTTTTQHIYQVQLSSERFKQFIRDYIWELLVNLGNGALALVGDLYTFVVDFLYQTSSEQFSFEYKILLSLLLISFSLFGLIVLSWYIFKDRLEYLVKFEGNLSLSHLQL